MNILQQTLGALSGAITADPFLALARAACVFDPMWCEGRTLDECENTIDGALIVARQIFPEMYIEAILMIHAGATYAQLEWFFCRAFTEKGIPTDDLEYIGHGFIPIFSSGLTLVDSELEEYYPDEYAVLRAFAEPDEDEIEFVEHHGLAAHLLVTSLADHPSEDWQNVSWMLQWMFSLSGNTIVDYDTEAVYESVQPMDWTQENYEFAVEMMKEANEILDMAKRGVRFLRSNPDAYKLFCKNTRRALKAAKKGKKRAVLPLRWAVVCSSNLDAADSDTGVLPLRDHADQTA